MSSSSVGAKVFSTLNGSARATSCYLISCRTMRCSLQVAATFGTPVAIIWRLAMPAWSTGLSSTIAHNSTPTRWHADKTKSLYGTIYYLVGCDGAALRGKEYCICLTLQSLVSRTTRSRPNRTIRSPRWKHGQTRSLTVRAAPTVSEASSSNS